MAGWALLAIGAVVVPCVTTGGAALPPPLWIGIAAAGLVAIFIAFDLRLRGFADGVVAALLGAAASIAHLVSGMVAGHDTQHHVWGAWAWLQAWKGGDYFPLWLHHVGLGMPLPMFYGPLPFYAMAPAALAGFGVDRMVESSFALAGVSTALTTQFAVKAWTQDRRAALVAAAAAAYAPYRLLDANYRCALGETWGLAVFPLVLLAFDRLMRRGRPRDFLLAAASISILALAHPLSLALAAIFLCILWLARSTFWRFGLRSAGRAALRVAGGGIAGLLLGSAFLFPLAIELKATSLARSVTREEVPEYALHGVHLDQLIARHLWSELDWSAPERVEHPSAPEMPFYFGTILLLALLAALLAAPAGGITENPLLAMGAAGSAGILLSLHSVAGICSKLLPPIDTLQFPWRLLGPASLFAAFALGLLVANLRHDARGRLLAALLAMAALADGFAFSGAVGRVTPWQGLSHFAQYRSGLIQPRAVPRPWPLRVGDMFLPPRGGTGEVGNLDVFEEYFTDAARTYIESTPRLLGIRALESGAFERVELAPYARGFRGGRAVALPYDRGPETITVHPGRHTRYIEVAEQYFPGWEVELEGKWYEATPTRDGLLSARLARPAGSVRFRFSRRRWDRLLGWALTGATAAALVGLPLLRARRNP